MTTDKPLKIGDCFQHGSMHLQVKAVPDEGDCCSGCVAGGKYNKAIKK